MRISYGPVSFDMPEGFQDDSSISISRPQKFDKKGKPLDELGYPLNISINRDKVGSAPDPLRYLQAKLTQMRPQLDQFKLAFAEKDQIGAYPAAKAQFSFAAHFALHQLVIVWFVGEHLMSATLGTTEKGIDEGWKVLRSVVESIQVQG